MSRAFTASNTTATRAANVLLDHRIVLYGITNKLLAEKKRQLVGRFLAKLCGSLRQENLMTSAYHPQTKVKGKNYNKTVVARMQQYVVEHQDN